MPTHSLSTGGSISSVEEKDRQALLALSPGVRESFRSLALMKYSGIHAVSKNTLVVSLRVAMSTTLKG